MVRASLLIRFKGLDPIYSANFKVPRVLSMFLFALLDGLHFKASDNINIQHLHLIARSCGILVFCNEK